MNIASISTAANNVASKASAKGLGIVASKVSEIQKDASSAISTLGSAQAAANKLSSLGVNVFNPLTAINTLKSSINTEHLGRLDTRNKLASLRGTLEKSMASSDLKSLAGYTTGLQNKAQDAFVTAVTDGIIKEMNPKNIKNPIDDSSSANANSGEQSKNGLLDTALSVLGSAKDIAVDASSKTFMSIGNENSSASMTNNISNLLNGGSVNPLTAKPEEAKAAKGLLDNISCSFTNIAAAAISPAIENKENANDSGFLSNLTSSLSGLSKQIIGANSAPENNTATSSNSGFFKSAMNLINSDLSGTLSEKNTENMITSMTPSIASVASNTAIDSVVGALGSAWESVGGQKSPSNDEIYNTIYDGDDPDSIPQTKPPGAWTSTSVMKGLAEVGIAKACASGDSTALVKSILENKTTSNSAETNCKAAVKSCTQTPDNVKNILISANVLSLELNTVTSANIKTPTETSNVSKDQTKKVSQPPINNIAATMNTVDLTEYASLSSKGTTLSKAVLGIQVDKKCAGFITSAKSFISA